MSDDRRRILDMLSAGKITVAEAEQLLNAISGQPAGTLPREGDAGTRASDTAPKYLRVVVEEGKKGERVNVRVPIQLIRAGIKLGALMPDEAKAKVNTALEEKGVNLDINTLKPEDVEELVEVMADLTVDVDGGDAKVRVFCE